MSRLLSAPAPRRGPAAMAPAARADSASVLCDAPRPAGKGVADKGLALGQADRVWFPEASPFASTPYHPLQEDGKRQGAVGAPGCLLKQADGAGAGERPAAAGTACGPQQPVRLHAVGAEGPDLQRADCAGTPACDAAGPRGHVSGAAPEPAAPAGTACPAPQPAERSRGSAGCSDLGSGDSAWASGHEPQRTQGATSAACCEDGGSERAQAPARQPAEAGSAGCLSSGGEARSGPELQDSGGSWSSRPLICDRQYGHSTFEQHGQQSVRDTHAPTEAKQTSGSGPPDIQCSRKASPLSPLEHCRTE